jgi:hypothetical protein
MRRRISLMSKEDIHNAIDDTLQRNVEFRCKGKILKTGKVINVNYKNFLINFTLEIKDSLKSYDLYYPFDVQLNSKRLLLDYRIDSLIQDKLNCDCFAKLTSSSKLFNDVVEVYFL